VPIPAKDVVLGTIPVDLDGAESNLLWRFWGLFCPSMQWHHDAQCERDHPDKDRNLLHLSGSWRQKRVHLRGEKHRGPCHPCFFYSGYFHHLRTALPWVVLWPRDPSGGTKNPIDLEGK
jgi:hypothetical protein